MPKTSYYKLVDYFLLFCMLMLVMTMMIHTYVAHLCYRAKNKNNVNRYGNGNTRKHNKIMIEGEGESKDYMPPFR